MTLMIGVAGRQGVGKSTLAKALQLVLSERGYKTAVCPLAETIKDILANVENYNPKELRRIYSSLNTAYQGKALGSLINQVVELYTRFPSVPGQKNRKFLQHVGTELGRNVLGNDVWVNACISRAKEKQLDVALVDDCRFPNEVEKMDFIILLDHMLNYDEWLQVCDDKGYSTSDNHVSESFDLSTYAHYTMKPYTSHQEAIQRVLYYVHSTSTVQS
jgi:energy-coupling factor transporter ATP-binding protein EcfA2